MLLNPKFRGAGIGQQAMDGALSRSMTPQVALPSEIARREDEIAYLKSQLRACEEVISVRNEQIEHITKIR